MANIQDIYEYRDGGLYWKVSNSNTVKIGTKAGHATKHGYRRVAFNGKQLYEHRVIFFYHYGYFPKEIDHINGNKSDNRIENLRETTHSQNMMNVKTQKSNTSGVKGVCWDKSKKKWFARVTINNKIIHLGRFKDLELAELVVIEARNKYHKEFANHD